MTDLQSFLENRLRSIVSNWHEDGVYAISFFVNSNESFTYGGASNVTEFSVSYNTENDCNGAGELSEERWNYAFWRQNEISVIAAEDGDKGMQTLFEWYEENGIRNIGVEDLANCYDNKMNYIGRGPAGYYELLTEISEVARKMQTDGFIKTHFGRPVPIIIHDLEYSWYSFEATKKANPNGEADTFFTAMKELGCTE